MDKNMPNVEIAVKNETIANWRDKFTLSDFEILKNADQNLKLIAVKILKIPRQDDKTCHVELFFLDQKQQQEFSQKVSFAFLKSENETYRKLNVSKEDFYLTTEILSDFNFLDFSADDIASRRDDVKITKTKIYSWNLFDRKIALKLSLLVKGIETSLFVEYPLKIDILKLVSKLIEFDPEHSFLVLDDNFQFVPQSLKIITPDAHKYFNKQELIDLQKMINEVQLLDIRIKHDSDQLDLFNQNNMGAFVTSVKIRDQIFPNVNLFAHYDATKAIKKIKQILNDFSMVKEIKGAPRNLALKDIFENWKHILQNKIFENRGFENLIERQIEVITKNISVTNNNVDVEIILANSPNKEVIFTGSFTFEVSLLEELEKGNGQNIIDVGAVHKLNNSPKITEFLPADFISKDPLFEIKSIVPFAWSDQDIFSLTRNYQVEITYNNHLTFKFTKKVTFNVSEAQVIFNSLNSNDFALSKIFKQTPEFFQQLMNYESSKENWLELEDIEHLAGFENLNKNLDFKIKQIHFQRIDFTKENVMKLRLKIESFRLQMSTEIFATFKINVDYIQKLWKALDVDTIKLKNKNVLTAIPEYKLSLTDFTINDPYRLWSLDYQNNVQTFNITCNFKVRFLDAYKNLTKDIYYGDLIEEVINNSHINNLFSSLTAKDLVLKFDANKTDYDVDPEVKGMVKDYPSIFVKCLKHKLKNRHGNVLVTFGLNFGHNQKVIKTMIKFNNSLNRKYFKEYKSKFKDLNK